MDPLLKQRLIGATVLSALAVIFVPMLFEGSGRNLDTRDFEIPEIPAEMDGPGLEPAERLTESEKIAPSGIVPGADPNRSGLDTKGGEQKKEALSAWVIQVGSFNKSENADQLRDQLRQSGFPTYVETGNRHGETWFRVRVGPELDLKRARDQRDQIARKFNVKGIVLPVP
ncbi:MAG: SPOR domain-containing protein [Gammaproteobacteria bacterium]